MATLQRKNVGTPDETRSFPNGTFKILRLGDFAIASARFEPGWRWSEHVKPIAGTESCEAAHLRYVLSGRMKIVMDDGPEADVGPGDVSSEERRVGKACSSRWSPSH